MSYYCKFCDGFFPNRMLLDGHVNKFHKSKLVLAHRCDICGEKFAWFGDLTNHKKSAHYRYTKVDSTAQCDICGKIMKKEGLKLHVLKHSGKKPFSCQNCSYTATVQSRLRKHELSHSAERKYECEICQKKFKLAATLNNHCKRVHSEQEKPWTCTVCGKSFQEKSSLTYHIRTHTKEQPFQCTVCSRRFKRPEALKVHLRTHTKEKPYSCNNCGKTFSHKVSLVKHHRCPKTQAMLQVEPTDITDTPDDL